MPPVPALFARLLKPIPGSDPAGESLRYEGAYEEIRTARQEDDPVVTRGVWVAPLKRADWQRVESLCTSALEKRSKDLQIAVWLLEAWVRMRGFEGVRDGIRLISALCTQFWDALYPKIEDGDLDFRLAPIVWINDKLPVEVKLVPLSKPDSDDLQSYCWADWETARRSSESETSPDVVSQATIQQSVMLTPGEFYTELFGVVEDCVTACAELQAILEERCGSETPSLGNISRNVTQIRDFLSAVLDQRHLAPASRDGETAEKPANSAPPAGARPAADHSGPIRSRSEAYQRLAEAAEYLARTEPHSPAPYLVRRAIKWGGMELTELLPELVRNDSELAEIYRLLQMPER
jgi:type VI secretion system protein ImpA